MILLECAEDSFPMGRAEDFRFHASRPGASPYVDLICTFEKNGWVTLHEVVDEAGCPCDHAAKAHAGGTARISELNREGVQPAKAVDADGYPP
jgi:hypothetical protein